MAQPHPNPARERAREARQAHWNADPCAKSQESDLIFYCSRPSPDSFAAGRLEDRPERQVVETRSKNGHGLLGLLEALKWLGLPPRSI